MDYGCGPEFLRAERVGTVRSGVYAENLSKRRTCWMCASIINMDPTIILSLDPQLDESED